MVRNLSLVALLAFGICSGAAFAQGVETDVPFNEPDPEAPGVGVPLVPESPEAPAEREGASPAPSAEDEEAQIIAPEEDETLEPDASAPAADPPEGSAEAEPDAAGPSQDTPPAEDPQAPPAPAEDPAPAEPAPSDAPETDPLPEKAEDPATEPVEDPAETPDVNAQVIPDDTPEADDPDAAETAEDTPPEPADPTADKLLGYVADALIEMQALREDLEQMRSELEALAAKTARHETLLRQLCTDAGYEAEAPLCDLQAPGLAETAELDALTETVQALEAQLADLQARLEEAEPEAAPQLAEIQPAAPTAPFAIRRDGGGRPSFPARRELQPFLDVLPDASRCAAGGEWLQANVSDRIDNAFFVVEGDGVRRCTLVNGAWEAVFTGRLDRAHVLVEEGR